MKYISLDLTSAAARTVRAVDIAVLSESLDIAFAQMTWPMVTELEKRDGKQLLARILQVANVACDEPFNLGADGPQGLASLGEKMRSCERILGTSGKSPSTMPEYQMPNPVFMGNYIRTSLDLFAALAFEGSLRLAGMATDAGLADSTLYEIFPGAEWTVFSGAKLNNKEGRSGRQQRQALLTAAGLKFPAGFNLATPDQNDAAIGAYLLWCTRHDLKSVELAGKPPIVEGTNLREGHILHMIKKVRQADVVVAAAQAMAAEIPEPPELVSADRYEEWNNETGAPIFFTDYGALHGTEPENQWLIAGKNYECEVLPPHEHVMFTLIYSESYCGGRSWRTQPTIKSLIRDALHMDVPLHLRRDNGITVRVRIREMK